MSIGAIVPPSGSDIESLRGVLSVRVSTDMKSFQKYGWQRAVVGLFILGVMSSGCQSSHRAGTGRGAGVATPRASTQSTDGHLTSKVHRPSLMVSVNSIEILPPVVHASRRGRVPSPEEVQAMVQRTALEIMTLKITTAKAGGAARSRAEVDGLLRTEVTQYQEREGSSVGGEPATVSFKMTIVSGSDAQPIWEAQYYYRQEALSENLLRIGDRLGPSGTGAGWASGSALLQRGIATALEDFNRRREQQFVSAGR